MARVSNNFMVDDTWAKHKRDTYLKPIYGKWAVEGRYVFVDKSRCSLLIQQRFEVDTILQHKGGESICIEEKIARWKGKRMDRLFLETHSCTNAGHESNGWMQYGEADKLLYAFELADGSLDVYIMDFQKLKTWFWSSDRSKYRAHKMEEANRTLGLLVPIADIAKHMIVKRFHVREYGICKPLRLTDNLSLYLLASA